MRLRELIVLDVIVLSWMALSTDLLTTPKFVPREKNRPSNMKSCRIHARSVYPWIVGVWDTTLSKYVGLGSMITYISFITTCRQYVAPYTAYMAVGQYIWNLSQPDQPCMQEKMMQGIFKHPNCIKSPKNATFFDFAVFKLIRPFDISGYTYPTATFPKNPLELMSLIAYIDQTPETVDCLLPRFRNQTGRPPRFNWRAFVQAVPFNSKCVELLCEKEPEDGKFSEMCQKRLGQRANTTMMCMKNPRDENIALGVDHGYWYAGSPLTCSGTVYGVAAQAKIRNGFTRPPTYDIHFIVTFIRCWVWLNQQVVLHSPKWKEIVYVKDVTSKSIVVPSPNTPFPATKPYYFYDWGDKGKSDGYTPVPHLGNTVFPVVTYLILVHPWTYIFELLK